ncbi:MAG: ParB/RepB/Spo0J family partition protein [Planctomycetes bacterium]|nr:ParB/RepB/Spo0J family partition protein [Planctomycetota bacterium]MBI3834300.1 ParB/RepB/Spo0J family partition protein [Planctomycetota bacterium]
MPPPQKRLGRGLDSLVSRLIQSESDSQKSNAVVASEPPSQPLQRSIDPKNQLVTRPKSDDSREPQTDSLITISIEKLKRNPFQPREQFEPSAIADLVRSISQSGILQPILARKVATGFEIIAGERRWQAAKQAGLKEVPVIIRDASDEKMLELALVENIQRVDLNPVDRARAYQRFCSEFKLRPEEVARRVGEDRSTVSNYLRILELPSGVLSMVADGRITQGHARALLGIQDAAKQLLLAEQAARNTISVRALEEVCKRELAAISANGMALPEPREKIRSPHLKDLETKFEQALKTKVSIYEARRKGTGRITIEFYSLDDFDHIAEKLGIRSD